MKPPLRLHALPGLGDNIHARGVVPALLLEREVWFDTPHPHVFHDMPGLHFGHVGAPIAAEAMTCGYHPNHVPGAGSVLGAMAQACGVPAGDFRLPIPDDWIDRAEELFPEGTNRPMLIYRPLVDTAGPDNPAAKRARNPDSGAYAALYQAIKRRFFVVAVANCKPGVEWPIEPNIDADVDYTHGELDFKTMAALFLHARMVLCPPGFATVLAQAVETPCITVFGGFEDARSFAAGAAYAPWLPIEPITPCPCWSPECAGDKTIDLLAALHGIEQLVAGLE